MLIFKSNVEIPYATYAPGHYYGNIQHLKKGDFDIEKQIELPKIISKGFIKVDLFIHHPMVEYLLQAPDCCTLECEGFQSGFGRALSQEQCGFIGLNDKTT
jgi:lipopolysaccharide transport system ATP-binding protein